MHSNYNFKVYDDDTFQARYSERQNEIYMRFMGLYHNENKYEKLIDLMYQFYHKRNEKLHSLDIFRMEKSKWFHGNDMCAIHLYVEKFGGTLKGMEDQLDYLQRLKINILYLMPLLESPKGKSDGGFAVSDYRNIREDIGDINDLKHLIDVLHQRKMCLMMDIIFNHTSDEHKWAKKAKRGIKKYQDRYFFYDSWLIPNEFEETKRQIFPDTAPGNFTWIPECSKIVMTTFYPYQWDLNYKNPDVFNKMVKNILFLANLGVDILCLSSSVHIWKELGTDCYDLHEVHIICRLIRLITEIVCPGMILYTVYSEKENKEKYPEGQITDDTSRMAYIWGTVAMRDVGILSDFFKELYTTQNVFMNFLRNHDEIAWNWGFINLASYGINELSLFRYFNDYFSGRIIGSKSRGVLCYENLVTGEEHVAGTTASLSGLETAIEQQNPSEMRVNEAIKLIILLHALIISLPGVPMIFGGDEIGQLNDYSYISHDETKDDVRFLLRPKFDWEKAKLIDVEHSIQFQIFHGISKILQQKQTCSIFSSIMNFEIVEHEEKTVLVFKRSNDSNIILCIYNFYENPRKVNLHMQGPFKNMMSGEQINIVNEICIDSYGWLWLLKI
ncbi:Amylosucrase [Tritrichomonas foetus]|uniref:Amylosucrase n=1 Tax=Tritrichomonas foetus TaxID=1144522 RepID=A0A1J4K5H4_9EUKA|nr:Amylosucrase [Tritrichomonas foetus]|eukprot:OHT04972.1 Amylosucrase [Tritrichomonas foetus]